MQVKHSNLFKSVVLWAIVTASLTWILGILLGMAMTILEDRNVSDAVAVLTFTPTVLISIFFANRQWSWGLKIWETSKQ